jgi:hypothetical protein
VDNFFCENKSALVASRRTRSISAGIIFVSQTRIFPL